VPISQGISREHDAMHATQLLFNSQVYPCSNQVCPRHEVHSTEKVPFLMIGNFFLKGVVFMFWHDIVHIELLYCATKFEPVWT